MKLVLKNVIFSFTIILTIILVFLGSYFLTKYFSSQVETNVVTTNTNQTSNQTSSCGDGACSAIESKLKKCPADCQVSSNNNSTTSDISSSSLRGFVAIHMEPGVGLEEQKNLTNPKTYWSNLISLIETADKYNIKLTLLFNPQWAEYILQDNSRLTLLRSWEAEGHEMGYHQHGVTQGQNYWNGYTSVPSQQKGPHYFGTIEEAMSLLTQLPANGKIYTAGVNIDDKDLQYDWPTGVQYRTNGGGEQKTAVGSPTTLTINNQTITQVIHRIFIPGENATTLEDIEEDIGEAEVGQLVGIVFHVHNFNDETKSEYENLFQFFNDKEISIKAVKDILGE